MSLDVYLYNDIEKDLAKWQERKDASIKEAGSMIGLIPMIKEYYESRKPEEEELYWANITSNLAGMAKEAGIYEHLWHPEDIGIKKAKDLIEPLKAGLHSLKMNPDHYKQFNASNGWGLYEHFVPFVEQYLEACIEYPDSIVKASR